MSSVRIIQKAQSVKVVSVSGLPYQPSEEMVNHAVADYMDAHPEAQIPDGSITEEKLASDIRAEIAEIESIKEGEEVVGTANNLLSDSFSVDTSPYLFRSAKGARVELELDGYSVVRNQLAPNTSNGGTSNGITWTNNRDGTWTANGTATADSYQDTGLTFQTPLNHVFLIKGCPANGSSTTYYIQDGYRTVSASGDFGTGRIFTKTVTNTIVRMYVKSGTTVSGLKFAPQLIDITIMFGSTIADYVYTLEQANAGSGIAWLQSYGFLLDEYIPYDEGTIVSVSTEGRKIVGFNQLDEVWTSGTLNSTTGAETADANRMRSGFIPVFPNTVYYHNVSVQLFYYDKNKAFLSARAGGALTARTFTTPSGAYYLRAVISTTVYDNGSICINISDPQKNGTYSPYTEKTYPISPISLRGILKLSGDKLYADGDVYKSSGEVSRRYGVVTFNGTENWVQAGGGLTSFYTQVNSLAKYPSYKGRIVSTIETQASNAFGGQSTYGVAGYNDVNNAYPNQNWIYLRINGITTRADLLSWLANNPLTVVYELATPTTETTDPYTSLQLTYDGGTEEFLEAEIPVGQNSKIHEDLKKKIESIPPLPSANGSYHLKATVSNGVVSYEWSTT